ncbi:hypothetical protein [Streptomyces sp. NBC_00932]|uniref:hypothetical protein n=1 Tax=Streptomyces sp. NBC_00932 TaxID=2903690 RepID=UPI00386446CA|nr:hypothetical protein OG221_34475 [Streptomyces sp. NBC_00932]
MTRAAGAVATRIDPVQWTTPVATRPGPGPAASPVGRFDGMRRGRQPLLTAARHPRHPRRTGRAGPASLTGLPALRRHTPTVPAQLSFSPHPQGGVYAHT